MSPMMTDRLPETLGAPGHYQPPLVARIAIAFAVTVTTWDMNYRTRKQLARLDPHMLDDIGIERDAAYTEAARPFWR